jgi:Uma2 family endonuclease
MQLTLTDFSLPARLRFDRPMTDDELFEFCARNETLRVERDANGELVLMSPTGLEGSSWNSRITTYLTLWADQSGGGIVFDSNAGFTLPDGSMRNPDAAWMSQQRWDALPKREKKRFGHVAPQFVIELRSESDGLAELQDKMKMWIANGVELAWLIDPKRRVVEVYRTGEEPEVQEDPTSVQGSGPVRGFELVMARVWDSDERCR